MTYFPDLANRLAHVVYTCSCASVDWNCKRGALLFERMWKSRIRDSPSVGVSLVVSNRQAGPTISCFARVSEHRTADRLRPFDHVRLPICDTDPWSFAIRHHSRSKNKTGCLRCWCCSWKNHLGITEISRSFIFVRVCNCRELLKALLLCRFALFMGTNLIELLRKTHQFVTLSQFVAIFSYFHPLMKQMLKKTVR